DTTVLGLRTFARKSDNVSVQAEWLATVPGSDLDAANTDRLQILSSKRCSNVDELKLFHPPGQAAAHTCPFFLVIELAPNPRFVLVRRCVPPSRGTLK